MDGLRALLEAASTVVLVDWPRPELPAILLRAGFKVVGHGPGGYRSLMLRAGPPTDDAATWFSLDDGALLGAHPMLGPPAVIDIVSVYRPPDEQPMIARRACELGAKVVWFQPGPAVSDEARSIVESSGMTFVDGLGIEEAVRDLRIVKSPEQ